MKIAILGYGREGISLYRFLKKSGFFRNDSIALLDQKLNTHYLKNLKRFDVIFRSPGVPYTLPEVQRAKRKGIKISSATKIFFSLVDPEKIIGVTGTKGKGTTCTLIYQILKNAGKKVVLAGNIGKPMLEVLPQAQKADYVVLELSSFQLQDLAVSPHIAVVLDVFPDHLDAHKSLKEYYEAKANIGRHQKKDDVIFYFANNPLTVKIARQSPARKIAVFPHSDTPQKNTEMAAAVGRYLRIPPRIIKETVQNFTGIEHRLELVKTILIKQHPYKLENVRMLFVNDSAATNPEATAAAIKTFPAHPLILIAGGRSKIHDFSAMTKTIKDAKNLQMAVLFGENREEIRSAIRKEFNRSKKIIAAPRIVSKPNLVSAVELAHRFAKTLISNLYSLTSVVVLFSPASASFDQFKNYADRGEAFKKIVKML